MDVSDYNGKQAIFIQSSYLCLAMVDRAELTAEGLRATFLASHAPALSCKMQRIRIAGEDSDDFWSDDLPFGEQWQVSAALSDFLFEPEYWKEEFLYGGGFRIFFQSQYIERFIQRDLSWIDEFYNGDDADDDEMHDND